MNRHFAAAVSAITLVAGTAVYAVQDGRDPGERQATTSIVADPVEGDEILIHYKTIKFSDAPLQQMKEDPEARQQWARFIPQIVGAKLQSDVDLIWRQYTLPAGTYGLSFAMAEDGGWNLILLAGDRPRGRIPLDVKPCDLGFDYLCMNLMSAGADRFRLLIGYGGYSATVEFGVAPDAEGDG